MYLADREDAEPHTGMCIQKCTCKDHSVTCLVDREPVSSFSSSFATSSWDQPLSSSLRCCRDGVYMPVPVEEAVNGKRTRQALVPSEVQALTSQMWLDRTRQDSDESVKRRQRKEGFLKRKTVWDGNACAS